MPNYIRRKYEPNCDLRMTLRSRNNNNNRKTYEGDCEVRQSKVYSDNRHDKCRIRNDKYRNNLKRKLNEMDDECDPNKENIRPRKRRRKNNSWGNKSKQRNRNRNDHININNSSNSTPVPRPQNTNGMLQKLDEYINIINDKINQITNPQMKWSDYRLIKRYKTVKLYYIMLKRNETADKNDKKLDAYAVVEENENLSENTIRKYRDEFEEKREITQSLQGHFGRVCSGLDTAELKLQFTIYLNQKIKDKKHFSIDDLLPWINNVLLKNKAESRGSYKGGAVREWMLMCGFKHGKYQKAQYIDGHNRDDVVQYRKILVRKMIMEIRPLEFTTANDNDKCGGDAMKWVKNRRRRKQTTYIRYIHDESTIHIWDKHNYGWYSKTVAPFLPKSDGRGYNISDFVSEFDGFLRHGEDRARFIHKIGKGSGEFYFSSDLLLKQVEHAVEIHYKKFQCVTKYDRTLIVPQFSFDNASIHTEMPDDALTVKHMNINPAGKQARMKNGWYWRRRRGRNGGKVKVPQSMINEQNEPKGVRAVLEERGFNTKGIYGDELRELLSKQKDFMDDATNTRLMLKLKELGVGGDYAPKFHSELQLPIENCWCDGKRNFRNLQDFKINKTHEVIKKIHYCLDMIPLPTVRRYFRKMRRFEDAYDGGATSQDILDKVKQLKQIKASHRSAPRVK